MKTLPWTVKEIRKQARQLRDEACWPDGEIEWPDDYMRGNMLEAFADLVEYVREVEASTTTAVVKDADQLQDLKIERDQAIQTVDAILNDEKLPNGQWPHLLICN